MTPAEALADVHRHFCAEDQHDDVCVALHAVEAEVLRTAARQFVDDLAEAWGGDSRWFTTGTQVAEVVACVLREMAADAANGCRHEWLDRPESDTRECLLCGSEVAG